MWAVPCCGACTRVPFATSTRDVEDLMSLTRSDLNGVMWLEQPESMSHSDMKEKRALLLVGLLFVVVATKARWWFEGAGGDGIKIGVSWLVSAWLAWWEVLSELGGGDGGETGVGCWSLVEVVGTRLVALALGFFFSCASLYFLHISFFFFRSIFLQSKSLWLPPQLRHLKDFLYCLCASIA